MSLTLVPSKETATPVKKDQLDNFIHLDRWLCYLSPGRDEPLKICKEINVIARARDGERAQYGRVVQFKNEDNEVRTIIVHNSELQSDAIEIRKLLASYGLLISTGKLAREKLSEYLLMSQPKALIQHTDRCGWHDKQFVLPGFLDQLAANDDLPEIYFDGQQSVLTSIQQQGSLDAWKCKLLPLLQGNYNLMFAVCVALAAPLLKLFNEQSGGFHFVGDSSTGKSTMGYLAASVIGSPNYVQRWRATSNGLEGLAYAHNDLLLIMDEIAQMSSKQLGEAIYMLGNEQGKTRSQKSGAARPSVHWKVMLLSNGEIPIAQKLAEVGEDIKAGQEVRLIDLPADAGKGFGCFHQLNGEAGGAELSVKLRTTCAHIHGAHFSAFVSKLEAACKENSEILVKWQALRNELQSDLVESDAHGQVKRVAARFSLVGLAGFLAYEFALLPWDKSDIKQMLKSLFDGWIELRGTKGSAEDTKILNHIRQLLTFAVSDKFYCELGRDARPEELQPREYWGARKEIHGEPCFCIMPEVFKTHFIKGFSQKKVVSVLKNAGLLLADKDNKSTQITRLSFLNKASRVYVIKEDILYDIK